MRHEEGSECLDSQERMAPINKSEHFIKGAASMCWMVDYDLAKW